MFALFTSRNEFLLFLSIILFITLMKGTKLYSAKISDYTGHTLLEQLQFHACKFFKGGCGKFLKYLLNSPELRILYYLPRIKSRFITFLVKFEFA